MSTSEAHILVTIPNATVVSSVSSTGTVIGQLTLEFVTYDIPTNMQVTRDVLLVVVRRSSDNNTVFEAPLDPARALSVSSVWPSPSSGAWRRYVFHATHDDAEFTVELPENDNVAADDIELFHSVLVGYVADVRVDGEQLQPVLPPAAWVVEEAIPAAEAGPDEDVRGRFVFMNEDDGEIVGTLDSSVRIREDPSLAERGRENDTLIVEVPEGDGIVEEEVFVRAIPPEDRDWVMKSAVFVSHAISGTTTLLTSAITGASNLYIARSRPSAPSSSSSTFKGQGQGRGNQPPPSRTLLLLQSPMTRKNLTRIHAVSRGAAKLSGKAAAAVDSLTQRTIGGTSSANKGKGRASVFAAAHTGTDVVESPTPRPPPLPSRSRGPSPAPRDSKPPLPARAKSPPTPARPSSRVHSPASQPQGPIHARSVVLSAALILTSIKASSVRLIESGGAAVTAAVTHKYGTAAGENAALAGQTARNVVLVYVDVHGLARRVIVKRGLRVCERVLQARGNNSESLS